MSQQHSPSARDDWRSILASILFAKTAVASFAIAPFLVGGYIDHLGLSPAQASQVLSAEIFALAIANALAFFWISGAACRRWAQVLLVSLIALNLSCIYAPGFEVLLLQRMLIGAAEGSLLALGFGLLGNTARPNRNFGLYFAVSLTIGAVNVRILPLFLEGAGVIGLFVNLSLYAVISLAGSCWAQRISISEANCRAGLIQTEKTATMKIDFPLLPLGFLLLANYVYFIGQGGTWAFLERLGLQQNLSLEGIANALALSLIAGVAGGVTAGWLDLKLGRIAPLLIAIGMAVTAILVLWYRPGLVAFALAASLFNFGNNLGHPYVLGFAAKIDKSARLTVLSGALHTGGQATGPLLAGLLVTAGDFTNVLWLGLVSFMVTVLLFIPVAALARK